MSDRLYTGIVATIIIGGLAFAYYVGKKEYAEAEHVVFNQWRRTSSGVAPKAFQACEDKGGQVVNGGRTQSPGVIIGTGARMGVVTGSSSVVVWKCKK